MNRKKILAAVLSAAMLISGTAVYAAAAEEDAQPAEMRSDFVKPGTEGTQIAPASPAEKHVQEPATVLSAHTHSSRHSPTNRG